jgi:hypothetical protein
VLGKLVPMPPVRLGKQLRKCRFCFTL